MYLIFTILGLSLTNAEILDQINKEYRFVLGEQTDTFSFVKKLYNATAIQSGNYFTVLLLNSSLTSRLELHYLEATSNDLLKLTAHESPLYTNNELYDFKGFQSIIEQEFKIKGKEMGIYYENEQILNVHESFDKDIEFKLCEALIHIDRKKYKLYVLSYLSQLNFYLFEKANDRLISSRSYGFDILYGLVFSSLVTSIAIYLCYDSTRSISLIKSKTDLKQSQYT